MKPGILKTLNLIKSFDVTPSSIDLDANTLSLDLFILDRNIFSNFKFGKPISKDKTNKQKSYLPAFRRERHRTGGFVLLGVASVIIFT